MVTNIVFFYENTAKDFIWWGCVKSPFVALRAELCFGVV